jgi:hypothetical protein
VISVAIVPSLQCLYYLITLLNLDSGEKSLVVILVVPLCMFVGGHSKPLPLGGAAISPWLAPAWHTVTRLSDIQYLIDINLLLWVIHFAYYSWIQPSPTTAGCNQWLTAGCDVIAGCKNPVNTLDCKNGARVLYSSIVF